MKHSTSRNIGETVRVVPTDWSRESWRAVKTSWAPCRLYSYQLHSQVVQTIRLRTMLVELSTIS